MSSSNSDSNDNNSNNSSDKPGTPQSRTVKKLAIFGVALTFAAFGLFTTVAIFNGLFSGGPFMRGFLGIFGFEIPGVVNGPQRVILTLGTLLAISWAVEIKGIRTSVPFWIGIGLVLLVLLKLVAPGWVIESIQFLGLIEFALGIPLSEINARRTVLLGVLFIVVYYLVLVRLQGSIETTNQGSTNPRGVASLTVQRLRDLLRTYFKVVVVFVGAVGTFVGLTLGYSGRSVATLLSQLMSDPGWGGYLATLFAYYVNYLTDWLPFQLSTAQFTMFILVFLAIAVYEKYG